MANVKISELPTASGLLTNSEAFPVVQGGTTKQGYPTNLGLARGSGAPSSTSLANGTLYQRVDGVEPSGSLYQLNNDHWYPFAASTAHGNMLVSPIITQPSGATVVAGNAYSDLATAISNVPTGGVVWIGDRTIDVGSNILTISKSNFTLLGNGYSSKFTNLLDAMYIEASNVIIRGIEFYGPGNSTQGYGIALNGSSFIHIERCQFHDYARSCISAVGGANTDIYIIGNYFWDWGRSGVAGRAAIQCVAPGGGADNNSRWFIIGNVLKQMTDYGATVGIGIDQGSYFTVDHNTVLLPGYFGTAAGLGGEGITMIGHHHTITNNYTAGGGGAGGILFLSYTGAGMVSSDNYCAGNTVADSGTTEGPGIVVADWGGGGPNRVIIENNVVSGRSFGVMSYDVGFGANMSNIIIRNNDLAGNTTTTSFISGTNQTLQNNKTS
jgi:hypothetical protein